MITRWGGGVQTPPPLKKMTSFMNSPLVIKLPIGDFELMIGVFRIGDWGFRIKVWGKINMAKTPIPNSKSPIGNFHF